MRRWGAGAGREDRELLSLGIFTGLLLTLWWGGDGRGIVCGWGVARIAKFVIWVLTLRVST